MKSLLILTKSKRKDLVDAAIGRAPVDSLIKNIRIMNVFTGEVYSGVIGILHGYIAYAKPCIAEESFPLPKAKRIIDGENRIAVPGFIDSHVHIESSMLTPNQFAKLVVPLGTTTVITDPHEIANVLGVPGVEYMLEAGKGLPMYQIALSPSCVPSVPGLESSGAEFGVGEISELLDHDNVIGIAEVMDFQGVINNDDRMVDILQNGFERDCFIQGHFFGDNFRELSAYICGGPKSNHEISTKTSAIEAARAGMVIDARSGSFSNDLPEIIEGVKEFRYFPNLTLCTDDREPSDIIRNGHINDCIRQAVASGLGFHRAVAAATLNAARSYGLKNLGAIAPGYIANINLIEDLIDFNVMKVFFEGRLVAEDGEITAPTITSQFPVESRNTVNIPKISKKLLELSAPVQAGEIAIRVIDYQDKNTLLTQESVENVRVKEGRVVLQEGDKLNFIAVINRHGNDSISVGLTKNFYLNEGVLAGTVSHDAHNLVVIYRDIDEAFNAVKRIKCIGGGIVYLNGEISVELSLPVAGLMTNAPVDMVIDKLERLNTLLFDRGVRTSHPIMRLFTAALPVIPNIKITDLGLVDVKLGKCIDMFCS